MPPIKFCKALMFSCSIPFMVEGCSDDEFRGSSSTGTELGPSGEKKSKPWSVLKIEQRIHLCDLGRDEHSPVPDTIFQKKKGSLVVEPGEFQIARGVGPSLTYIDPQGRKHHVRNTKLTHKKAGAPRPDIFESHSNFEILGKSDGENLELTLGIGIVPVKTDGNYIVGRVFPHNPNEAYGDPDTTFVAGFAAQGNLGGSKFYEHAGDAGWCNWIGRDDDVVEFDFGNTGRLALTVHSDWENFGSYIYQYTKLLRVTGSIQGKSIDESDVEYFGAGTKRIGPSINYLYQPAWWALRFREPVQEHCGIVFFVSERLSDPNNTGSELIFDPRAHWLNCDNTQAKRIPTASFKLPDRYWPDHLIPK